MTAPFRRTAGRGLGDILSPEFFKALCDRNRLAILEFLSRRGSEATVGEIAGCCPIDLSVVSRHLATLRDAGILHAEKRGKQVHYRLAVSEVAAALRALADALETRCEPQEEK